MGSSHPWKHLQNIKHNFYNIIYIFHMTIKDECLYLEERDGLIFLELLNGECVSVVTQHAVTLIEFVLLHVIYNVSPSSSHA